MNKEFLRNFGRKTVEGFCRFPDGVRLGLAVPIVWSIGGILTICSATRGRFDREYREQELRDKALRSARDAWFDSMKL